MKKSLLITKAGNISRPQLMERSNSISLSAKRDIIELTPYGVTPELLVTIDDKAKQLKEMQFAESVMGKRVSLTGTRNSDGENLKESIGLVRSQLSLLEFTEGEVKESVLYSKLSGLNIEQLEILGLKTLDLLKEKQTELAVFGITEESITSFETLVNKYIDSHHAQANTSDYLNNYTADRSKEKSELFKLISFVSKVGKAYWLRKDKARSGDYVLYKRKAPPKKNGEATEQETTTTTVNSF